MKRKTQRNIGGVLAIGGMVGIPATALHVLMQGAETSTVQTVVAIRDAEFAAIAGVVAGIGIGLVVSSYIGISEGSTKETERGV